MESMFSLDDVGRTVSVIPFMDHRSSPPRVASSEVVMVIKTPRGQATIFKPDERDRYYGSYIPQAEAVKVFMEQHRDSRDD